MNSHSPLRTIALYNVGDTTIRYRQDDRTGRVGLELYPTAFEHVLADRLPDSSKEGAPVLRIDPMIHLKIVGDKYTPYFAQGRTMRLAPSIDRFKYLGQRVRREPEHTTVVTDFAAEDGLRLEHRMSWYDNATAFQIECNFINGSDTPVTLEMLSSFSLGGISPFDAADSSGRLQVHRFRSVWAAEARLTSESIESLHLERSATAFGAYSERFGQTGSMPTRGWFPFAAVEDTVAGVVWGAQLAWAGSWQMEIFRHDDQVCISGGLADREFGHWKNSVKPGETLTAPSATVACAHGNLNDLCDRLTDVQHRPADQHPKIEQHLPIIFNEWCTTWGRPTHDRLENIAKVLKPLGVEYLVIDAGWYRGGGGSSTHSAGDWLPKTESFPDGLAATSEMIRSYGLIPGLWFEAETCAEGSIAFSMTDHLLKRDGIPITVGERRFWDLNDPVAIAHLSERVIELLAQCDIGYLKIDYNETIGIGCDHQDSLGEGMRQQTLGLYSFLERIRARLPDLVIENCASGGHRLEPSMLGRTAMSSFSDAHELQEIPIIAANLHSLMLPRQSQVWAVLRKADCDRRLVYSLSATLLGRMCLSGDIDLLSQEQLRTVHAATELYTGAASVIKNGRSLRFGNVGDSWRHPVGWQAVTRLSDDGRRLLVVAHAFADAPAEFTIDLPGTSQWTLVGKLVSGSDFRLELADQRLTCTFDGDFSGVTLLLVSAN